MKPHIESEVNQIYWVHIFPYGVSVYMNYFIYTSPQTQQCDTCILCISRQIKRSARLIDKTNKHSLPTRILGWMGGKSSEMADATKTTAHQRSHDLFRGPSGVWEKHFPYFVSLSWWKITFLLLDVCSWNSTGTDLLFPVLIDCIVLCVLLSLRVLSTTPHYWTYMYPRTCLVWLHDHHLSLVQPTEN